MLGVMAVTGAAIMIKNNRRAFLIAIVTIFVGLALVCVSTFGEVFKGGQRGLSSPLPSHLHFSKVERRF